MKRTATRVISRPQPTVHEAVEQQQRQRLTPFKTPVHSPDRDLGKPGTKVSRNSRLISRPQMLHSRTSRVHFKTFDDWIEARRANCDTLLKDVSSFISEKEEDWQSTYPSRRQPNSQWTPRSSHIDRGKISMGDCPSRRKSTMEHRGKSTMERNTASPAIQRQQMASNGQRGKVLNLNRHGRPPPSEHFIAKEAKMPKSDSNDSFQDPQPRQRRRVTVKDTNRVVADRATE